MSYWYTQEELRALERRSREDAISNREARIENLRKHSDNEECRIELAKQEAIRDVHRRRSFVGLPAISDEEALRQHQQTEQALAQHQRIVEMEHRFQNGEGEKRNDPAGRNHLDGGCRPGGCRPDAQGSAQGQPIPFPAHVG